MFVRFEQSEVVKLSCGFGDRICRGRLKQNPINQLIQLHRPREEDTRARLGGKLSDLLTTSHEDDSSTDMLFQA